MINSILKSKIDVFTFIVIISLFFIGFWGRIESSEMLSNAWLDFLYSARTSTGNTTDDIVIVVVDEPSFKALDKKWPWPRRMHAKLVNNLSKSGAKAVVFDILFPEPSRNPEDDHLFAQALKNAGNVALGIFSSRTQRKGYVQSITVEPIEELKNAAAVTGYVNHFPDSDGILRYAYKKMNEQPSLAFACMAAFDPKKNAGGSCRNNTFLIDYEPDASKIPVVSYYQVLNNLVSENFFKDKFVFVGLGSDIKVDVQGAVDAFPTPFFRFKKEMMYGVAIHANALNTMLNGCKLEKINSPLLLAVFFILALVPFWVRKRPMGLAAVGGGGIILVSALSMALFNTRGMVLDIVPSVFAIACNTLFLGLNEFRQSHKEKKYMKQAFESYVSSDIVKTIIDDPSSLALGGEKKQMTVMFADITGFTTVSEKLTPEELVSLLNDYFKFTTDMIIENKGTLDKYIGDAIMAFFGAPVFFEDHAAKACAAALLLDKKLNHLTNISETVFTGITMGINSGEMIVGNVGSEKRFDYTVIGDEVNLASRLEALNKIYGTSIILGENTKTQLDETLFLTRELDLVRVKGKFKAVPIYELLENTRENKENIVMPFATGLAAYRNREWENAEKIFNGICENFPSDGPAGIYVERCQFFAQNPPPENWDYVWEMKTK